MEARIRYMTEGGLIPQYTESNHPHLMKDWAESDMWNSRRVGEANMPAMSSQHSLLQPVTNGQNRTMASRKDKLLNIWTPLYVQYIGALDLHNIRQQCHSLECSSGLNAIL